ncbi:MAG: cytochrome c [Betaproteobacteria bacterium]|nr:cytochrome c [Betaproteobacteria bacterium]
MQPRNPRVVLLLGVGAGFAVALLAILLGAGIVGRRQAADQEARVGRGSELYGAYCQTCHGDSRGIGGQPGVPSHGPEGHTWHHSDRNLTETILNGSSLMAQQMEEELEEMRRQVGDEIVDIMRKQMGLQDGAPRMPAWRGTLADEDIDAVLAYIRTFWTPEQQRAQQQTPMMR